MTRDGHIHVLPIHVANKIAAGEVVERPASVVKELVENAIDAGAKSIRIAISQGGRKLVSVQDDGCGMTCDDAVLCLERQATSKILDVGDIDEIGTLGFRGEAIPSIASVSRFLLTTRRHDEEEGVRVEVNAGVLADVRSAGCPPGTLVEVRDLFCNVPARLKFLRAYATEEAHVRSIYTVNALAHPGIAFSLTVDQREVSRLAPAKSPEMRIRELFGADFADALLRVDCESGSVGVTGFVERPNRAYPSRRPDYIFINGRPASAPVVQTALREAYPRRQGDAKPAAILFISLPPKEVDVNVHPAKREVRFRKASDVRTAIVAAISQALGGAGSVELAPPPPAPSAPPPLSAPAPSAPPLPASALADGHQAALQPNPSPPRTAPSEAARFPLPPPLPVAQFLPFSAPPSRSSKPWEFFRFLAISESGFIILETEAGIVFVNPRAARERIAFEKLCGQRVQIVSQPLLVPEMVSLSPADFARLRDALEPLHALGWKIEPFGQGVFKVEAVPQLLGDVSAADVLATVAADLASSASARSDTKWREDLIAKSLSSKWASSQPPPDGRAAVELVEQLAACRLPYVCPRGRSTMIFMSVRELERRFEKG